MRPLEEALESAGLRFTIEGGKSFFDRQEVHEVLAVCARSTIPPTACRSWPRCAPRSAG
jgi:superfamily I DNA/RNA helicase